MIKPYARQNTKRWRHIGCDSVSNHQPHDCLLNSLFRHRSKKTWKLASLVFVLGILWPVNSPYKGPVTRKMFPFDDVIMKNVWHDHTGGKYRQLGEVLCITPCDGLHDIVFPTQSIFLIHNGRLQYIATATLHLRHTGISNHWYLHRLYNSPVWLTLNIIGIICITGYWWISITKCH